MAIVIKPLFVKMKRHFTNSAGNHQRVSYWTHAQTVYVDSDSEKGEVDEDDRTKYFRTLEEVLEEIYHLIELSGTDVVREPASVGQLEEIKHGAVIDTSWIVVNGKGAIPECYTHHHQLWFEIEDVLPQADKILTMNDERIKEYNMIELYTTIYGQAPKKMTIEDGKITMEFKAQKTEMGVKARVWY